MIERVVTSPDTERDNRIPPRQVQTRKWPVLHYGTVPHVNLLQWDFTIFGLVEEPVSWNWEQFRSLPSIRVKADMHCVTRWSLLDNEWQGVSTREVMKHVRLKPEARFVLAHCEDMEGRQLPPGALLTGQGHNDFTTNLPLDDFLGEDCLFAWSHNGQPITPDHGYPLRLVVPRLYAWKSAKWIRGIELTAHDRPGFWERNGYHMRGNPWTEERYG